jgi:hypothetical protein
MAPVTVRPRGRLVTTDPQRHLDEIGSLNDLT